MSNLEFNSYDNYSPGLDRRSRGSLGDYYYHVEKRKIIEWVDGAGKTLLDVGTGNGSLLGHLAGGLHLGLGVDLAFDSLRFGSLRYASEEKNIRFALMDAEKLAVKDDSIDVVTAIGTFEGGENIEALFKEINRVLRAGGIFIFTVWNKERWCRARVLDRKLPGSKEYTRDEVISLTERAGFSISDMCTTFYIPRRLFWFFYNVLFIEFLRKPYLRLCKKVCLYFLRREKYRMSGWVMLVRAQKIR